MKFRSIDQRSVFFLAATLLPTASAFALTCTVLKFGGTVRCMCPTTYVSCDDGREGYVFNSQFKPHLLESSEGQVVTPVSEEFQVYQSRDPLGSENSKVVEAKPLARYSYMDYGGKRRAIPPEKGVLTGELDQNVPGCAVQPDGKARVWPKFCTANIYDSEQKVTLLKVCQTTDGKSCPDAADCMANASSGNSEWDLKPVKVRLSEESEGMTWSSSEAFLITPKPSPANQGSTLQPMCLGRVSTADGPMIGTGPMAPDGSCEIKDVAKDVCMQMVEAPNGGNFAKYQSLQAAPGKSKSAH